MRSVGFEKALSVGMSKTIRRRQKTLIKAWQNEEFGYD